MKIIRNDLHQVTIHLKQWLEDASHIIGTEAVNEVHTHFQEESAGGAKWKARLTGTPRNDRRLLSDTNTLEDSVRYEIENNGSRVVVGVDEAIVPYARIHQEGGIVPITGQRPIKGKQSATGMRSYFWAMYMKTGSDYWKSLALAKGPLKVPARPYMVMTDRMMRRIEKALITLLKRIK